MKAEEDQEFKAIRGGRLGIQETLVFKNKTDVENNSPMVWVITGLESIERKDNPPL